MNIHSPNLFIWILTLTIGWFLNTVQAGILLIDPVEPAVEIGQSITLSVPGASGNLKWTVVGKGRIEGEGSRVTYIAPDEIGYHAVRVGDDNNIGVITVEVLAEGELAHKTSPDNAVWEILNNRHWVKSMALSKDGKTLWVGTNAGLEQRDTQTGQLIKVFTTLNGLPNNNIEALAIDNNGGLWVGTKGVAAGGLAHFRADGKWSVYDESNSGLPNDRIETLLVDEENNLWIGTLMGLVFRQPNGDWQVAPSLSDNWITALAFGNGDSTWIGTYSDGLFYYHDDERQVFNTENSGLPDNQITSLQPDQSGGVWIATWNGGLAYRSQTGEWTVFTPDNSALPGNYWVQTLLTDGKGGIWIGAAGSTTGGLAHLNANREWTVFNTDNSGLPDNFAYSLLVDAHGNLWVGTVLQGLASLKASGEWTTFNTNSGPQGNSINTLVYDKNGEMWVGTDFGLAHHFANGKWEMFNSINSALPGKEWSRNNFPFYKIGFTV